MDAFLYEQIAEQIEAQAKTEGTRHQIACGETDVTVTHYDKGRFHIAFECDDHTLHQIAERLPHLEKKLNTSLPYQVRLDRPRRKTATPKQR